jgi:hypothetical protein
MKNVKVRFYRVETVEVEYFAKFQEVMKASLSITANHSETFEQSCALYSWVLLGQGTLSDETPYYHISVAKEKDVYPVTIGTYGEQKAISERLGERYHLIFCPTRNVVVALCSAGVLKAFFSQFGVAGIVRIEPYFRKDSLEKVLYWDIFRRITFAISAPNDEAMDTLDNSKSLSKVLPLRYMDALKINLSLAVGSNSGKGETLTRNSAREVIGELYDNEYCTSLKISGYDFEGAELETIDLKNDPVVFDDAVELKGHYIEDDEAKTVLLKALGAERDLV